MANAIEELNLVAGIDYLKSTNDPMLIELAEVIEKNGKVPDEEELVQLLVFLLTFSIGCQDLKIPDLADKFNTRAEQFVLALNKWGMVPGKYKNYVKKRWDLVTYSRIKNKALAIATYKRAGSVNKY